jgi:hypothetical protein
VEKCLAVVKEFFFIQRIKKKFKWKNSQWQLGDFFHSTFLKLKLKLKKGKTSSGHKHIST